MRCTDVDGDGQCDEYGSGTVACCEDAPLDAGVCGGATALAHATYPLMGGSFLSSTDAGATCDYDFFKVSWDLRLFDAGFRCCFDEDPR
jgi:hypothetical protein